MFTVQSEISWLGAQFTDLSSAYEVILSREDVHCTMYNVLGELKWTQSTARFNDIWVYEWQKGGLSRAISLTSLFHQLYWCIADAWMMDKCMSKCIFYVYVQCTFCTWEQRFWFFFYKVKNSKPKPSMDAKLHSEVHLQKKFFVMLNHFSARLL
jgi:hypothetical protein